MSALFLIAAMLSSDPQPEKIESIVFLGTPEYAAKVRTFKLDYDDARYAAFLQGIDGFFQLHFAVVNDCYFFKSRHEEDQYRGGFVNGNTGAARLGVFLDEDTLVVQKARASHLKHGDCCWWDDAFDENEFNRPSILHALIDIAAEDGAFARESPAATLKKAPVSRLKSIIGESYGEIRRAATKELERRGAASLPVVFEFLSSDDRNLRLIGLGCLSTIDADIELSDDLVLKIIRHTATEDFPIGFVRFDRILHRRSDTLVPRLLEIANDPTAPAKERAYVLWFLAGVEDKRYAPLMFDLAMRPDTEPIIARAAVRGLDRRLSEDKLIQLLGGKNKTARMWACYYLATYSGYKQFPEQTLLDMSQEPDPDIRAAAKAAHEQIAADVKSGYRNSGL